MKVLFLDIDGVCNSRTFSMQQKKGGMLGIDPAAAALVRKIVEQTGCKVVLSSFWRLRPEDREVVRREVCRFIDTTPYYPQKCRGDEVAAWLEQHPTIRRYAILDDDSDFLPNQWLFQTTFDTGITEDIAQAVIDHLNAGDRRY